jgi:hypothetical protein
MQAASLLGPNTGAYLARTKKPRSERGFAGRTWAPTGLASPWRGNQGVYVVDCPYRALEMPDR